jgi:hypothetical protein
MCERTKAETIKRAMRMIAERDEQRTYREKVMDDRFRAWARANLTADQLAFGLRRLPETSR